MQDVTKPDLTGAQWAAMTVAERLAKCQAFEKEALMLALAAHPETKRTCMEIAAQWHKLAADIEKAERGDQPSI